MKREGPERFMFCWPGQLVGMGCDCDRCAKALWNLRSHVGARRRAKR